MKLSSVLTVIKISILFSSFSLSAEQKLKQGLKVDESCFQMGLRLGKTPDELKQKLQAVFDEAEEMVVNKCSKRYKELSKYIAQWKKQLETSSLLCGGPKLATLDDAKKNEVCHAKYEKKEDKIINCNKYSFTTGISYLFKESVVINYSKEKAEKILGKVDNSELLSTQYKGVFALSEYLVNQLLNGQTHQIIDTITHELFHLTDANNRHDHNEIEALTFDEEDFFDIGSKRNHDFCGNNVTKDRIVLITGLCLDNALKGANAIKVPEALSNIRSQCGDERSCVDIFNSEKKITITGWSSGISESDAKSLCQKIFFEGSCQKFFKDGSGNKVFYSLEPIKSLADKAIERLTSFFPKADHEIPKNLMDLMLNGSNTNLEDLKNDKCLSQILINSAPSGDWYLAPNVAQTYKVNTKNYNTNKHRWEAAVLNDNISYVLNNALKAMENHPYCTKERQTHRFQELFAKMKENTNKVFRSDLTMDLVYRWVFNTPEKKSEVDITSDEYYAKKNRDFIEVMGKDIIMPYLKARSIYHPTSPHFDCINSPARNNATFFSYRNFISDFKKSIQPKLNCPN